MKVFASLLLAFICHEAGHMIMAYILGVKLKFKFSLALSLEADYSCQGLKESLVALSGPLANMILAFVVPAFAGANTLVAIVNLIPVLPLDGGRFLRGILSKYISWLKLTKFLSGAGMLLAMLLAYFAVLGYIGGSFWWLIFAAYVFYLGIKERVKAPYVLIQALIKCNNEGFGRRSFVLPTETNLRKAFYYMSPGWQNKVVIDGHALDGKILIHNWLLH